MNFLDLYNSTIEQDKEKAIRDIILQKLNGNEKPAAFPFLQVDVRAGDYKAGFHPLKDNKVWVLLCDNHIGVLDNQEIENQFHLVGKEKEEVQYS